uniref:SUZ domain-containing protein n=1 Tax=Syphacia muris TaxID=451379 RepID=A0A0N5AZY9_9BILA
MLTYKIIFLVSPQFEQRQRQILKRKQKEEELAKAREAAVLEQIQQYSCGEPQKPGGFKILKRPQSYGVLPSSSNVEQPKSPETQQSKQKSLEERQAAYKEARERIFADYTPEKDASDIEVDNRLNCLPGNASSSTAQQHMFNHIPIPRARPPASLINIRSQPYQAVPGNPAMDYPFAHHVPTYPALHHPQRVPVVGQVPFYDARIPPPPAPVFSVPTMMGSIIVDQQRASATTYGRPPTVLLAPKPFSATSNTLHQSGER